ncbi:hypothetical protein V1289_000064 [Bradyrhizobium sp. AZCC 2289]
MASKKRLPVLVGDVEKILRLENPGIVDEDVDLRQRRHQGLASGSGRDIGGNAADLAARHPLGQPRRGGVDLRLRPSVDHHAGPGRRKAFCNRVTDAGGRARHQRGFSRKVDIHVPSPSVMTEISEAPHAAAIAQPA